MWSQLIPIEGNSQPARYHELNAHKTSRVISQNSHSETGAPSRCAYVMLANFSNEPLAVPKATVLGVVEEISDTLVDRINPKCRSTLNVPMSWHTKYW